MVVKIENQWFHAQIYWWHVAVQYIVVRLGLSSYADGGKYCSCLISERHEVCQGNYGFLNGMFIPMSIGRTHSVKHSS
jgi:hypothetical protein